MPWLGVNHNSTRVETGSYQASIIFTGMYSGTCAVCGVRVETTTSEAAVGSAQNAVLEHIRMAHAALFEQLPVVNIAYLVQTGARTFSQ